MALFEKGKAKTGGRRSGARNKLSAAFLEAFSKDFEEHGEATIRILRVEHPQDYVRAAVALLPKEFEITDSRLQEIPDDELNAIIEYVRRQYLAAGTAAGNANSGKDTALN